MQKLRYDARSNMREDNSWQKYKTNFQQTLWMDARWVQWRTHYLHAGSIHFFSVFLPFSSKSKSMQWSRKFVRRRDYKDECLFVHICLTSDCTYARKTPVNYIPPPVKGQPRIFIYSAFWWFTVHLMWKLYSVPPVLHFNMYMRRQDTVE